MKASLRLEYIGASNWDAINRIDRMSTALGLRKPDPFDQCEYMDMPGPRVMSYRLDDGIWVASRVHGSRDYRGANSRRTRGVFMCYVLDEGALYRVKEPTSWRCSIQYYCIVANSGDVVKLDKKGALQWAKNALGITS